MAQIFVFFYIKNKKNKNAPTIYTVTIMLPISIIFRILLPVNECGQKSLCFARKEPRVTHCNNIAAVNT